MDLSDLNQVFNSRHSLLRMISVTTELLFHCNTNHLQIHQSYLGGHRLVCKEGFKYTLIGAGWNPTFFQTLQSQQSICHIPCIIRKKKKQVSSNSFSN